MNPLSEQPVYITLPHMHIQAMKSLSEATGYIMLTHMHIQAMKSLSEATGYITLLRMHIQAMKSLSEATGYITLLPLHTEAMHSLDETIRSDRHVDDPDVAAILGLPRPHRSPFPGLAAATARRALPDRPARAHGGRRHGLAMRRDPRPSPARA